MNQSNNENHNMQTLPSDDRSEDKLSHITQNIESSLQHARRTRFFRRLLLSIFLAVLFVLLLILGRDLLTRNEFLNSMDKISRQIKEFQTTHNNELPSLGEFLNFEVNSRNLHISNIKYGKYFILNDSPPQTVLAHTIVCKCMLLEDKHVVLYLDGSVKWISPEALLQKLEQREENYAQTITEQP
jgi:hypothetical protein